MIHAAARLPLSLQFKKIYFCSNCLRSCNEEKCQDCFAKGKMFQVLRFIVADVASQIALLFSRNQFIKMVQNPQSIDLGISRKALHSVQWIRVT